MKKKNPEKVKQGKKNRKSGADFERKVRADLESKGWTVSKWMNQVELEYFWKVAGIEKEIKTEEEAQEINLKILKNMLKETPNVVCMSEVGKFFRGKLIPAKHKFVGFGRPMAIGTGFPDFIAFRLGFPYTCDGKETEIIGVECKSNGYLDKEEKEKCKWLLDNNVFSKILIAKKGEKRGEIIYNEFKKE